MASIYIIRHGQASLGSHNYDELSALGQRQAALLGQHFADKDLLFNKALCGTLHRHTQTAENLLSKIDNSPELETQSHWNEFDFKALVKAYLNAHPQSASRLSDTKSYFIILKQAMRAWQNDELTLPEMESYSAFQTRVKSALDSCRTLNKGETALVVSSGGVIAMILSTLHGLSGDEMIDLNMEIKNSSLTQLSVKKDRITLSMFNATPHLERFNDPKLITFA